MIHFDEIWFDLDGTLAVPDKAWNVAHDALRYQVYADFLGTKVNDALKQRFESLYSIHKSNSAVFRSLGLPADYWINHFESADMSIYYKPRTDVPEVLGVLTKRATLGLFTNNKLAVVQNTLSRLNIPADIFTTIITGDEIEERKPNLHGFRIMLERSNCAPDKLLYIGDRYHVDIEPAQKLGAKGGLVWSSDERADFSFPEFTDLLTINQ